MALVVALAVVVVVVVVVWKKESGEASETGGDCKGGIVVGKAFGDTSCLSLLLILVFGVSSVRFTIVGPVSVGAAAASFSSIAGP